MSYKKERSMKLQDKVKRLLAANATLRETIKAKDEEIDSLQSLNDFQQQQISCMESDIEQMKCCQNCDNSRYTEQGTTCKDDDLECEGFSYWVIRR